MLEHVDRMQLAVRDRAAAAQTFVDIFDATVVGDDELKPAGAKRRTVHAGTSEFEFLEPAGDGLVAEYIAAWGEGLFAAGFSTRDVAAVAARLSSKGVRYTEAGNQLLIEPDQTPGLRMVISPEAGRPMVGLIRYLYEATNLIDDHTAAAGFYADGSGSMPRASCRSAASSTATRASSRCSTHPASIRTRASTASSCRRSRTLSVRWAVS